MSPPSITRQKQATPSLGEGQILFTVGVEQEIEASADRVFEVITSFEKYAEWNTWIPTLEVEAPDGQAAQGAKAKMVVKMEAQNKSYDIPLEILKVDRGPQQFTLAWRGEMLPSWAYKAERVQTVTPISETRCLFKQWESMAGLSAYVFKYAMGVDKQLEQSYTQYAGDLKRRAESS